MATVIFSSRLHGETLLLRKLPQLPVPVLESDIVGMKARVRHMNIIGTNKGVDDRWRWYR
jgi:hypothetical protein